MYPPSDTTPNNNSKDDIGLIPVLAKSIVIQTEIAISHASETELTATPSHVPGIGNIKDALWLPRESNSSDDTGEKVRRALNTEKEMTLLGCCRQYPKAIGWSILLFLTVVMEGYDKSLIVGFIAFPTFRERYGELSETPNGPVHEISPLWQMGLQNAAVASEILGLLAHGYVTYSIGYKKMMIISLVWLCLSIFPALFAPSIGVLLASQALCGMYCIWLSII